VSQRFFSGLGRPTTMTTMRTIVVLAVTTTPTPPMTTGVKITRTDSWEDEPTLGRNRKLLRQHEIKPERRPFSGALVSSFQALHCALSSSASSPPPGVPQLWVPGEGLGPASCSDTTLAFSSSPRTVGRCPLRPHRSGTEASSSSRGPVRRPRPHLRQP
jgi:hypothetical protein